MLITAGTLVTGDQIMRPGWVRVDGDRIVAVGHGAEAIATTGEQVVECGADATIMPGFVDMHVHGGGGGSFPVATAESTRAAVEYHQSHGTTTMMASLVSASPSELLGQVSALAEQVRAGLVVGIHLEGPWINERKAGAHERSALRNPDPGELASVLAAGGGHIRMVTLAPELPGGIAAVRTLAEAGVIAAIGHTDASYEQAREAIRAGARVATHLFNAMRPIHHREPGPVIALMEDPGVTVELITDGQHVHPALYRDVCARVGDDRVVLITDAMEAAGMADGGYRLGGLEVTVADGVARLTGTNTIAGSTATMDQQFRFALAHSALPADEALLAVTRQTSVLPAATLGLQPVVLAPEAVADVVILDQGYHVAAVLNSGRWVVPPPAPVSGADEHD